MYKSRREQGKGMDIRAGSICIECSMVLPIFLILTLCLFSLIEMNLIHGKMNAALHASARELSVYSYALGEAEQEWTDEEGRLVGFVSAETFIRGRMISILGMDWFENSLIVGKAAGVHYYRSNLDWENQELDLIVTYRVCPFSAISNLGSINMVNRCRMKLWTGYHKPDADNGYVYAAKTGEVYHLSRYCTYLNPSVREVLYGEVDERRNQSGGKYYLCENCGNKDDSEELGYVFITDYGERYHTSVSCKNLKRTIMKIKLSEVGSRGPCKKCVGQ